MRVIVATCLFSAASLSAYGHGARNGGTSSIDEQELRLESEVAAIINLIGPAEDADPVTLGQRSLFGFAVRWPNGKKLTVCMQHKSKPLRVLIAKVASEWLQRQPNISLDFGNLSDPRRCDDPSASYDIRVADQPASQLSPYWSWVGIQALSHAREWTMDLGFSNGSDRDAAQALQWAAMGDGTHRNYFHFVVLHEFGHALGALHEHQWGTCAGFLIPNKAVAEVFPSATTAAAKQAALANLQALTKTQIDQWGAIRLTAQEDPQSVMRYDFPADIYRTGAPAYCSNAEIRYLSNGDLQGLTKAYPQPAQAASQPAVAAAATTLLATNAGLSKRARDRVESMRDETVAQPSANSSSAPMSPIRSPALPSGTISVLNRLVAPPALHHR